MSPAGGPVVTIDGPAGSGKSTTARAVAERLGLRHLDSGALYRALTYGLLERGLTPESWSRVGLDELRRLPLGIRPGASGFEVLYEGRLLGSELRTDRVTRYVSRAAALPVVRERLLDLQREAARNEGLVADGRDMGSVVFPDAEVKVFLTADLRERARRRARERIGSEPGEGPVEAESHRIRERDRMDTDRSISPLRRPEGALLVDTTDLGFEEQVRKIVDHALSSVPDLDSRARD